MKVISIKEPFATLIMKKDKRIETRSWKTNYRGEILIHASIKNNNIENEVIRNIIKNYSLNHGNIICIATLVDCVYMDESFIEYIKKDKKEYTLGLYEIGRYAWILDNIRPIIPIPAKGKLNFWNYEGEYKLLDKE